MLFFTRACVLIDSFSGTFFHCNHLAVHKSAPSEVKGQPDNANARLLSINTNNTLSHNWTGQPLQSHFPRWQSVCQFYEIFVLKWRWMCLVMPRPFHTHDDAQCAWECAQCHSYADSLQWSCNGQFHSMAMTHTNYSLLRALNAFRACFIFAHFFLFCSLTFSLGASRSFCWFGRPLAVNGTVSFMYEL